MSPPKHILKLQNIRRKKREKDLKFPSGIIKLQVLGNGAEGGPRCLYLFTDHTKYMFNCGEGSQRLAHEHKMKLGKLEHVFLTNKSWENVGGCPGMFLSLQEIGVPDITLHGSKGIENLFKSTKEFVHLDHIKVKIDDATKQSFFEDRNIHVEYVPIIKDTAISYICQLHSQLGQLNKETCTELGVPKGPLLGLLKCGQDITLPNGNILRSSDVVQPSTPGPVFIIVECPEEKYLNNLLREPKFAQYNASLYLIVHFTPSQIVQNPLYRQWMETFPESTEHLILNNSNTCMGSIAVHEIQHKLNLLDNDIFPILSNHEFKSNTKSINMGSVATLSNIVLQPRKEKNIIPRLQLKPQEYILDVLQMDGVQNYLTNLKIDLHKIKCNSSMKYPELLFLGTASCISGKTRNTSGILLNIEKDLSMILDCGEGSYGQLMRYYGREDTMNIISSLKAIFISHIHADHDLGLISFLKARNNLHLSSKLHLVVPDSVITWLTHYNTNFEKVLQTVDFTSNEELINIHTERKLNTDLNMSRIQTCLVKHCRNAYGISLQHITGWKITYSGDTMPCDSLVQIGQNSDILIHEATMGDELAYEARRRLHSTVSEAISIGNKMNAQHILLTHFSQRYGKFPNISNANIRNVGIAFDNMMVRFSDLPKLPMFIPVLKSMFPKKDKKSKKTKKL